MKGCLIAITANVQNLTSKGALVHEIIQTLGCEPRITLSVNPAYSINEDHMVAVWHDRPVLRVVVQGSRVVGPEVIRAITKHCQIDDIQAQELPFSPPIVGTFRERTEELQVRPEIL